MKHNRNLKRLLALILTFVGFLPTFSKVSATQIIKKGLFKTDFSPIEVALDIDRCLCGIVDELKESDKVGAISYKKKFMRCLNKIYFIEFTYSQYGKYGGDKIVCEGDGCIRPEVKDSDINNAIWYLHQLFKIALKTEDYEKIKFAPKTRRLKEAYRVSDDIELTDIFEKVESALEIVESYKKTMPCEAFKILNN